MRNFVRVLFFSVHVQIGFGILLCRCFFCFPCCVCVCCSRFMLPFAIILFSSFYLCCFWFRLLTDILYLRFELKEEISLYIWFPHMKYPSKWQTYRTGAHIHQHQQQKDQRKRKTTSAMASRNSFFLCSFPFRFDIDPKLFFSIWEKIEEERSEKKTTQQNWR